MVINDRRKITSVAHFINLLCNIKSRESEKNMGEKCKFAVSCHLIGVLLL
jgi:hypothetical protein